MKKFLIVVVVLVVLLLVLVGLAPTIASMGLANSIAKNLAAERINGSVELQDVSLRWFGGQSVNGLIVQSDDGQQLADIDISLDQSLWSIVFGGVDKYEPKATGEMRMTIYRDGSTSLDRLMKDQPAKQPEPKSNGPLEGTPGVDLRIDNLKLVVEDEASGHTYQFDNLAGDVEFMRGEPVVVALASDTTDGNRTGNMRIDATLAQLIQPDGAITLPQASVDIEVEATNLRVPMTENEQRIDRFTLAAKSNKLSESLNFALNADTSFDSGAVQPSNLRADLTVDNPVDSTGAFQIDPARISGDVVGRDVPTSLLQPFLKDTPVRLTRDVGTLVDLAATFSPGEQKKVSMNLTGEHTTLVVQGDIDPTDQSLRVSQMRLNQNLTPELMRELANYDMQQPLPVRLEMTKLNVPGVDESGARPLGLIEVEGVLAVEQAVTFKVPTTDAEAEAKPIEVRDMRVTFASTALYESIAVDGAMNIGGGSVTIDQTIAGLMSRDGAIAEGELLPTGSVTVANLPLATVQGFAELPAQLVELLGETINAQITNQLNSENQLVVAATANGRALSIEAQATRLDDGLRFAKADVTTTLSPNMLRELQVDAETPVLTDGAVPVTLSVAPFTMPGTWPADYRLPSEPITVNAQLPQSVKIAQAPQITQPVTLRNVVAQLTATLADAMQYELTSSGAALTQSGAQSLADFSANIKGVLQSEPSAPPTVEIELTNVAVDPLLLVLGQDSELIDAWVGRGATAEANVATIADGYRANLIANGPQLQANLAATYNTKSEFVTVTSDSTKVTLQKDVLNRLANPHQAQPQRKAYFRSDIPLDLNITKVRLPVAMLTDKPFDPETVTIDVSVEGGAFEMAGADGQQFRIDGLTAAVSAADLNDGVRFVVNTDAGSAADEARAMIDVDGTARNLVDAESKFDPSNMSLEMTTEVREMPTALADALANMQGKLVDAVGPMMNATFVSRDFSKTTGVLNANIETTNGYLRGPVRGTPDGFAIASSDPLTAQLAVTDPLKKRVLDNVWPLFRDIASTVDPIQANVSNAVIPTGGDVSKLSADINLTVGELTFNGQSPFFKLIAALSDRPRADVPGRIDPIVARIRNGVVTYDRFNVQVDKFTLPWDGTIDLVNRTVDLRTEMPLAALATTFRELRALEGVVESVPIKYVGPMGQEQIKLDPKLNIAELAAKAGLQKAIDKNIDGDSPLNPVIRDILPGLLGGGKKKDEPKEPEKPEADPKR